MSGSPLKDMPSVLQLSALAHSLRDGAIYNVPLWAEWREVFENLGMAHFAHDHLMQVEEYFTATNDQLQGSGQFGAFVKYHSACLVQFAQAAIELTAARIKDLFQLKIGLATEVTFHARRFKEACAAHSSLLMFLDRNSSTIRKIKDYRVAWFHHLSGGAGKWSSSSPSFSDFRGMYGVQIDPKIIQLKQRGGREYWDAINRCKSENGGRWVYPLHEFANLIYDGSQRICLEALDIALGEARTQELRIITALRHHAQCRP
jgi:hypothetical protein